MCFRFFFCIIINNGLHCSQRKLFNSAYAQAQARYDWCWLYIVDFLFKYTQLIMTSNGSRFIMMRIDRAHTHVNGCGCGQWNSFGRQCKKCFNKLLHIFGLASTELSSQMAIAIAECPNDFVGHWCRRERFTMTGITTILSVAKDSLCVSAEYQISDSAICCEPLVSMLCNVNQMR